MPEGCNCDHAHGLCAPHHPLPPRENHDPPLALCPQFLAKRKPLWQFLPFPPPCSRYWHSTPRYRRNVFAKDREPLLWHSCAIQIVLVINPWHQPEQPPTDLKKR